MTLFDFSETDKLLENFFGKEVYKWLNRIIRSIAIIGILLCIIAYFLGMDDIINIYTLGYTLLIILVGFALITGIIRCICWITSKVKS